MNGLATQLTLMADRTEMMAMQIFQDAPASTEPEKKSRRKTKTDKQMSKALERANEMGRKQNGELRKGWNQSRIMQTAHRLRRKMNE